MRALSVNRLLTGYRNNPTCKVREAHQYCYDITIYSIEEDT